MGKTELESSLSTLDLWLIVFGLFVAIGVVGESVVGFLHWRRSGQLQALQTAENLTLQRDLKDTELKLEELRALAGPRQIDPARFLAALARRPKATVIIQYDPQAADGFSTGWQISRLLTEAGWTPFPPTEMEDRYRKFASQTMVTAPDGSVTSVGSRMVVLSPEGGSDDPQKRPDSALMAAIVATLGGATGRSDPSITAGWVALLIFSR